MVSTRVSIPGYHVSEEIYNGSRTLVYRGYREADELPVVIKLLKNPYPGFSELLSFRNQYTIAKNLNSPLIIKTYSLEQYQNGYALVMEDFGGISLQEWIVKGKNALSLRGFLQIAIALCNALDILYRSHIIHKDIKPSNILINPQTKQVKLIDFSIASLLPRETQTLINPNGLEGTLAYISPEQTGRMNRGIDSRTDFYSLGVTFYELLTGKLPFSSNEPMELVHCHIAKVAPLVHEINSEIPSVISKIVSKLMAKNAEDRYQSALGLKFDLENCLHQLQETGIIKKFEIAQQNVCDRFLIPDKLYGRESEVSTLLQAFERVANPHPPKSHARCYNGGNPPKFARRVSLLATSLRNALAPLGKGGFRGVEMMLVAGFSGIGKTAVVNEVHKPIVRWNGYFIKGKYDQFNRNIPLSAFVQAFRDLMGQLLSESDEQLAQWKQAILSALGENGQVLIEVIPELEQIIGKQTAAPELSGTAAQNRFNLLFQKFIQVFTTAEHPLVMFLDDLQWADSASLNLMQVLMSQSEADYLFIIGAYRDNEVFPAHPLMLTLEEITKAGVTVSTLTLNPLSQNSINHLIADTLSCSTALALPLTELVYQKTKGNPFFTTQFLKSLHEEGYIAFDLQAGHWQCDMATVRSLSITDDVVEFMALQLQKLPLSTQNVLKLAACIGNQFDLATLAIVSEQSEMETATALWKALQEGLILPQSEIYKFYQQESLFNTQVETEMPNNKGQMTVFYKFLHDRVQQAAYSLIPHTQKQQTHLHVGQLLLQNVESKSLEANIFEIVNHLNLGIPLINQPLEKAELASLNLIAGQKAKTAIAYEPALSYFKTGLDLLAPECWQVQYDLALTLHERAAEVAYLLGHFESMQQFIQTVFSNTHNSLDKVTSYQIQIQGYAAQGRNEEVMQTALSVLQSLGIELPAQPSQQDIQQKLEQVELYLSEKHIEDLVNLDKMTDPKSLAIVQILSAIIPVVFNSFPQFLPLVVLTEVDLSIRFGNAALSPFAYALYGVILCGTLGDIDTGYQFGQLAMSLLSRWNIREAKSSTLFIVNYIIKHWKQPIKETFSFLQEAYFAGLECGDLEHAAWSIALLSFNKYLAGTPLEELEKEMALRHQLVHQTHQERPAYSHTICYQAVFNLIGATRTCRLMGQQYDETVMLPIHVRNHDLYTLCHLYTNKLMLSVLFQDYTQATADAQKAEEHLDGAVGMPLVPLVNFYSSLTQLANYANASLAEQSVILEKVAVNQDRMEHWASLAPVNYLHKFHLIEAQRQHILGQKAEAIDLYDLAIAGAKANEYIQEESVANELAAKFYLEWGKERIARDYMIEAYYGYTRWGAKAKVADLERRYPQLLAPILEQSRSPLSTYETISNLGTVTSTRSTTSGSSSASVALDLATILKASQTISGEIELQKLLSSLLSIVIENAGADKCVLMLAESDKLLIQALAKLGQKNNENTKVDFSSMPIDPEPFEESVDVPLGLINTVKRSLQPAVIIDATVHPQFINDPYIQQQQPKSILCSPILHQGKLLGVLYLENSLVTGAFTSDRVELLNLLCAQAAISLENAQLYQKLQTYSQQLEQSLAQLSTSQSRFHNLVDNVPGVVYQLCMTADGLMSLTYISANCYNLYEITPEQAIANVQTIFDRVHPEDATIVQQSIAASTQTLTPWYWEGRIVTLSGIVKWIHGESRIQQQTDGTLIWDGVLLDISARRKAELALQQKSLDLQQALNDLQNAQLQIVQNEKMSALGNLIAGVAHEMNNPLGFISVSLKQAKTTVADITEHLKLYQQTFQNKSEKIIDHAEEIDLDYTLEDLPKIIDSMTIACDRLKNISTGLRTFSRADKDYKVPFNIHEGIDSTILILKHRLKASEQRPAIEVITNYGNLPQIECFPSQLNQVFMNILANAIDALDESNIGRTFAEIQALTNRITIKTSREDEGVKITIADNGIGMTQEVQQKVFDHLFTTKAVGKGTGLGLAIARQIIVDKHGGAIAVNSNFGEETQFVITLPV